MSTDDTRATAGEAEYLEHAEAMVAEFTPAERRMIRIRLGIAPTPTRTETL